MKTEGVGWNRGRHDRLYRYALTQKETVCSFRRVCLKVMGLCFHKGNFINNKNFTMSNMSRRSN